MTTKYCTDANMEIHAGATIFCGEDTIEITQYGCCFTDEHDRDLMGSNEINACERFQAAIIAACGRAQRAAMYEGEIEIEGMGEDFIQACTALFAATR